MPRLPTISPTPTPVGRRASPEDFGVAQGQANAGAAAPIFELGQLAAQVQRASDQAKASLRIAQAGSALESTVLELGDAPNPETHEELYRKRSQELRQSATEGLSGAALARVEAQFQQMDLRAGVRLRDQVRNRQIRDTQADTQAALNLLQDQAGRASGDQLEELRAQAAQMVGIAQGSGAFDSLQAQQLLRGFESNVSEAHRIQAIRADPAAAYAELENAESPLARGLSEVQRLQAQQQALDRFQSQLEDQRAAIRFAQSQQDRDEKQVEQQALKDLDDLAAKGDLRALAEKLSQSRPVISPESYRHFLDVLEGRERKPVTVPDLYVALEDAASRGEPIAEVARQYHRQGMLDQDDLRRLEKTSEDVRFKDAQQLIRDSLRQSLFTDKFDTEKAQREAEAVRAFSDWKLANPDAQRVEALRYARSLVRWTGMEDLESLPPETLLQADMRERAAELIRAQQAGEITQDQLDAELKLLDDRIDAERRAAPTPGGNP